MSINQTKVEQELATTMKAQNEVEKKGEASFLEWLQRILQVASTVAKVTVDVVKAVTQIIEQIKPKK